MNLLYVQAEITFLKGVSASLQLKLDTKCNITRHAVLFLFNLCFILPKYKKDMTREDMHLSSCANVLIKALRQSRQ